MQIQEVRAQKQDVAAAIDAIVEAMSDEDEDVLMLACLSIAVLIQDPNVKEAKFLEIIQSTSEFIALQLVTTGKLAN